MNAARGDVELTLDGVVCSLRLTFGALAEIETGLGVANMQELARRLQAPSASDLLVILSAVLRGAGCEDAAQRLPGAVIDLRAATRAVADVFNAAFR